VRYLAAADDTDNSGTLAVNVESCTVSLEVAPDKRI